MRWRSPYLAWGRIASTCATAQHWQTKETQINLNVLKQFSIKRVMGDCHNVTTFYLLIYGRKIIWEHCLLISLQENITMRPLSSYLFMAQVMMHNLQSISRAWRVGPPLPQHLPQCPTHCSVSQTSWVMVARLAHHTNSWLGDKTNSIK